MGSYQIPISIPVTGGPAVEKLSGDLGNVAAGTAKVNAGLEEFLAKNNRIINAQKTYAEQQAKIAELTDRYHAQQQRAFEAEERGWRAIQAAHEAAAREEARRQAASVAASGAATAAMKGTTASVLEARAAVQALEGQFGTMAAGRWLAQLQGLGPLLGAAFSVAGPLAMVSVVENLIEKVHKWVEAQDPLVQGQTTYLSILQQTSAEYDALKEKLKALNDQEFERVHGRDALLLRRAGESAAQAGGVDQHNIERLERLARVLREVSRFTPVSLGPDPDNPGGTITTRGTRLSASQASALQAAAAEARQLGDNNAAGRFAGIQAGSELNAQDIASAQLLLQKGIQPEIENARLKQQIEAAQASANQAQVDKDRKAKEEEEAKKAQEQQIQKARALQEINFTSDEILRRAQGAESTGLSRINAQYDDQIAKLREAASLKGVVVPGADIRKINQARVLAILAQNREDMGAVVAENAKGEDGAAKLQSRDFVEGLRAGIEQNTRDINSGLRVLGRSDESDADAVRRGLEVFTRTNQMSVRGGGLGQADAARRDLLARKEAAKEIFDIETRNLQLIDDKDKRADQLAAAKKKRADEEYRAEADFEEQIFKARMDNEKEVAAARQQDLGKYREMASGFFDALRGHSTGTWFKQFALGQERQLFSNATSGLFQRAGNSLGGLIPQLNIPGIGDPLHGTIFDSQNNIASTTASNTKSTSDNTDATSKLTAAMQQQLQTTPGSSTYNPSAVTSALSSTSSIAASIVPGSPLAAALKLAGGPQIASLVNSFSTSNSSPVSPGYSSLGTSVYASGPWAGQTYTPAFDMTTLGGSSLGTSVYSSGPWAGQEYTPAFDSASPGGSTFGSYLGGAAGLGLGALGIYNGVKQGGISGGLEAGAGALGAAGAGLSLAKAALGSIGSLASAIPILGAAAPLIGLVAGLFSNGPQQRSQQITDYLNKDQYLAPTALNVTQGMNGAYEDFDARGNLRTSNLWALPTVAEPFITKRTLNGQQGWYDAPGVVQAPFQGGATGTGQMPVAGGTVIHNYQPGAIQTMDNASFHEFINRPANANSVGTAVHGHITSGNGDRLVAEIQRQVT